MSKITELKDKSCIINWSDENNTMVFAQVLAQCLIENPSFRTLYLELEGDLGAGKTTFVRYLLQALGVQGRIKSPTYTVLESYDVKINPDSENLVIWHFDFYRFADPQEWEDAGFRDVFASAGLKLVEWSSKVQNMLPAADLQISIQLDTKNTATNHDPLSNSTTNLTKTHADDTIETSVSRSVCIRADTLHGYNLFHNFKKKLDKF